ncbi:MAG: hypothetical protein CO141_01940 [Candidatus Moranbacteria bacterium CG_4_9_14_3_um_filter_42_9]|nr:MAG: hypothetical protein CO141_01940 [Candidatus Moranbacteria bacterium CG_4_9_14_3_um_filter_42_9]
MGELLILVPKPKRLPKVGFDEDISKILQEAIEITKQSFGREDESIFQMYGSFENLLRSKIGTLLLTESRVNMDLFRCSLYVSEMLGEFLSGSPESYNAMDYFTRGHEECEPDFFKKGGDLCFILCTFFEGRCDRIRRPMKLVDYLDMGSQLYFTYHAETRSGIGYCMGENFREIVSVTKRSIRTL